MSTDVRYSAPVRYVPVRYSAPMWSPFTNLPLPHFLHPEEEVGGPLGDGDGTGQSEGTSGLGWSSIRLAPCGQY